MAHKVIAISGFWATVLTGVTVTGIGSGIAYAIGANRDFAVMQNDLQMLKSANLTTEVPVIKEQIISIKKSQDRMEVQQQKIADKLDKLVEKN